MASSLRHLDVGIPVRGMDTDSSPSQLSPQHAVALHNVVVDPQEIRPRRGWTEGAGWYDVAGGTPANWWPGGVVSYDHPFNAATYIAIAEQDDTTFTGEYLNINTGGSFGGTLRGVIVTGHEQERSGGAAEAAVVDIFPTGPAVQYDGTLYFIGDDGSNANAQVYMWAGSNSSVHTSGGVTLSNGSMSGTFSSAPAASKANCFLTVTGGATGPLSGYRYTYRIVDHDGGDSSFIIDQPYGLGENTTNVPNAVGASTTISVSPLTAQLAGGVTNKPFDVGAVTVWRDRLWVARGVRTTSSERQPNKLVWSQVLYPQKWPSANNVLVGDNQDPIMALTVANDTLYIFKRLTTWIVTGYDEDSFVLRQLYGDIGCIDSDSICYYRGQIVFMSHKGLFITQGFGDPLELSQDKNGAGVRQELLLAAEPYNSRFRSGKVSAAVADDDLLIAIQDRDLNDVTPRPAWRYNFKYGQWSTWGNTSESGKRQPWFFTQIQGRTFAVAPYQMTDVSKCFAGEDEDAAVYNNGLGVGVGYITDVDYDDNDSPFDSTVINATVQFRDIRLGGPDTARLRGVQVEHNCQYFSTSSSPRVAWTVTMDVDSEIDSSATTVGSVNARYLGNVTTVAFSKYYTDRFSDTTFPTEGAVFRVTMSKAATAHSAKIFRVYLVTDPQATMLGRVDNATT